MRSKFLRGVVLTAILCCAAICASAQQNAWVSNVPPKEGDFVARDFKFSDGQSLPEVRLHYTTIGTPQRDASGRVTNAVLILHGTNRAGRVFLVPSFAGALFRARPVDRYLRNTMSFFPINSAPASENPPNPATACARSFPTTITRTWFARRNCSCAMDCR